MIFISEEMHQVRMAYGLEGKDDNGHSCVHCDLSERSDRSMVQWGGSPTCNLWGPDYVS